MIITVCKNCGKHTVNGGTCTAREQWPLDVDRFSASAMFAGLGAGLVIVVMLLWLLPGCMPQFQCPTIKSMPHAPNALVPEQELRAEWVKRFGPLPSPACDAVMQWVIKPHAEVMADCSPSEIAQAQGYHAYSSYAGCMKYQAGRCPLVTIDEGSKDDAGLQAHEFSHWALQCSWIGYQDNTTHTAERYGDPFHSIKSVWGSAGTDSFEGFFRAKYAGPP